MTLETDAFDGFPNSGLATAVPNLFFARVMPEIGAVEELVVTAYFFYAQGQLRRSPRFLTLRELESDGALVRTLARLCGGHDGEALHRGLEFAVQRGTLFETSTGRAFSPADKASVGRASSPTDERLFAVNTPANRAALGGLDVAALHLEETLPPAEGTAAPDIFTLYEQNVGGITPLIAEDLKEAEDRYPPDWIRAAMHEAVAANKRSWRYIARILQRWETEGPDYEKPERDTEAEWLERRYSAGKRRRPTPSATA